MVNLFKWMSTLSLYEGLSYFILVILILLLIPYSKIISEFFKYLVFQRKLRIVYFDYSYSSKICIGKDRLGREIYISKNDSDFMIAGSKISFIWKVEGAYRVDLIPLGKNLSGNTANSLIDSSNLEYTLEVYGFFGKKMISTINIPAEKIRYLDTAPISSYQHLVRKSPLLHHFRLTKSKVQNVPLSKTDFHSNSVWSHLNTAGSFDNVRFSDSIIVPNASRKMLYHAIDRSTLLKKYTFSTSKYNALFKVDDLNHNRDNIKI